MRLQIGLEITSRCNLACPMCGHAVMTREKADMPWDRFLRIVGEIKRYHHELRSIQWFGEPLLAKRFLDAIRFLREVDVPITNAFYTNATLLTPEMTDAMIAAGFPKVCKHTRKIWLGVDSMELDTYEVLRKGGDHEMTIANARYFCDAVKLHGVGVQRMLTRLNPREPLDPFLVTFNAPVHTRRCGRHWDKSRDFTVRPFSKDRRRACREHWGTLYVAQDGRVTSCCIDGDLEQSLGNIDDLDFDELAKLRYRDQADFVAHDYARLPHCQRCTGMEPVGR
jgi:MoaA/NifB/PqqE/SkfB family radical SAM enzyme